MMKNLRVVENIIISQIILNIELVEFIFPVIDETYFASPETKAVFNIVYKYYNRYDKLPPIDVISATLRFDFSEISGSRVVYNILGDERQKDYPFEWITDLAVEYMDARKRELYHTNPHCDQREAN